MANDPSHSSRFEFIEETLHRIEENLDEFKMDVVKQLALLEGKVNVTKWVKLGVHGSIIGAVGSVVLRLFGH